MKSVYLVIIFSFLNFIAFSQQDITIDKIWEEHEFYGKSVPGFNFMNDGQHYSRLEKNVIRVYDIESGSMKMEILDAISLKDQKGFEGKIDHYTFSHDENLIMIKTKTEAIYRHSTKAVFYIYNRTTKELQLIYDGKKIRYCTFSDDGTKVAFVFDNNLFYTDLSIDKTMQITNNGLHNEIINGATDWVYEEEFAFSRAFQWSPDGKYIGFLRFDEKEVPEFTYTNYNDDMYPEYVTFKYPKVGEKNAVVTAHIFGLNQNKVVDIQLAGAKEYYIPRIKWASDNNLCVYKMNRHQNHLQLINVDASSGRTSLLLEERNKYYIDITDDLTFLDHNKGFIWSSEQSGYNHLYLYDMNGKQLKALTNGNYDVTSFYGYDDINDQLYYQAAKKDAMNREIYVKSLNKGNTKVLIDDVGYNEANFSSTFDYFVNSHSTINTEKSYTVYDRKAKHVRVIEDNTRIKGLQERYITQEVEFLTINTQKDVDLNAWMIKPPNFDKNIEYPVFMYLYGGPGSQKVLNKWIGMNYWWFQMLAQQGYIVVCVDNRGTGARGEEFKKMTYMQLGHYETIDQINAAKYLGELPYTDSSRIGIFGWSYGGYMSSLCLFKGNDVFKAAIAVAPVTNWKWYDSVYTERYMRTEKENPEGYKNNSPVYFADLLKGNYLLIHGLGDDNVHFQNTAEMTKQLVKANKQFDTYFYPNRNHSIYGDHARSHLYTKMTNFVLEKL